MGDLVLIVHIAGERVALPAGEIEAVVEMGAMSPVPRAAPHVAGLVALRSRVLTAIDCRAAIAAGAPSGPCRDAIVAVVGGHGYGLLVDVVEDVVEISGPACPLPPGLPAPWARVATACVPCGSDLLLLCDLAALVAGPAPR